MAAAHAAGRGRTYYRLVQYPGAGFGGFYDQIGAARRSIDMEIYELADPTAEHALAAAAHRGVTVRVLLDRAFHGGVVNRGAFRYLRRHGVQVRWAPGGYIFHIKATTFDRRTSDISTANLTARYYGSSRDAEIIDTNPRQVRAVERTFANDWTAGSAGVPRYNTVQAKGLVWSPNTATGTAESALIGEISAALHSIDFESEELADSGIYDALAADARRGVHCRIVMTRSSEWDTAFRKVSRAGCHVHLFPNTSTALYIHEKLILDDHGAARQSLLIGSQNASVTSLTRNRELSILLRNSHGGRPVINRVARTFSSDYRHASPWRNSNPPATGSSCYPLSSSGHCYSAGEFCATAQHGMSGIAGDGTPIICTLTGGYWRWEPN